MKAMYKPVPKENCRLFRVEKQESNTEFHYPWHYHPEFELTLIQKKSGIRYVGNNIENYFDHDLVLLGSNLPHTWINFEGQEEFPKAVVIFFDQEFITWLNNDQFPGLVQLFKRSNFGIKFSKELALEVESKLLNLFELDNFEQCIVLMQVLKLLATTEDFRLLSQHGFSFDPNPTKSERINAVYQFVSDNYTKKISLEDVAGYANQ